MTTRKTLVGQITSPDAKPMNVRFVHEDPEPLIQTFTAGDTSPSVVGHNLFQTANTGSTTITDFDDGRVGQRIDVLIQDANTTIDFTASGLKGNAGVDWTPTTGDSMYCVYDGTDWFCIVSDNTA